MHANALGKLMNSWPVIIPPGPGVLCAYGDATTRVRNEASRTFVRRFDDTSDGEVLGILQDLAASAAQALNDEGVPRGEQTTQYQIDLRYAGQGMRLSVNMSPEEFASQGLKELGHRFDDLHEQLFTFRLDTPHELYNLRAVVQGVRAWRPPAPCRPAQATHRARCTRNRPSSSRVAIILPGSMTALC